MAFYIYEDHLELLDKKARRSRISRNSLLTQIISENVCQRDKDRREGDTKVRKNKRKFNRRKTDK